MQQDDVKSQVELKSPPVTGGQDHMIGSLLHDRYRVLERVGAGGFGAVYKADDTTLNRKVAIKLLNGEQSKDRIAAERFRREALAAGSLAHPNIAVVHDWQHAPDGTPYLVMEFVPGKSLHALVDANGPMNQDAAMDLFLQLTDGLGLAHQHGIIHRDLKPSNVIIADSTRAQKVAKLLDFGIAKISGENQQPATLTGTGEVLGTVGYMSPEQCWGNAVDQRTDIYSLGCIMYETLTGRPPFVASTALACVAKQLNEDPPTFAQSAPDVQISKQLESIVMKCLRKDPDRRFQSMQELQQALSKAKMIGLTSWGQQLQNNSLPWLYSNTGMAVLGGVGLVVVLAITFVLLHQQPTSPPVVEPASPPAVAKIKPPEPQPSMKPAAVPTAPTAIKPASKPEESSVKHEKPTKESTHEPAPEPNAEEKPSLTNQQIASVIQDERMAKDFYRNSNLRRQANDFIKKAVAIRQIQGASPPLIQEIVFLVEQAGADNDLPTMQWAVDVGDKLLADAHVAATDPMHADLHTARGWTFLQHGDFASAASAFRKAIDGHKRSGKTAACAADYAGLRRVFMDQAKYADAIKNAEEDESFESGTAGDAAARVDAAWCYLAMNQYQKASDEYQKASELFYSLREWSGYAQAIEGLAQTKQNEGDLRTAAKLFKQAADLWDRVRNSAARAAAENKARQAESAIAKSDREVKKTTTRPQLPRPTWTPPRNSFDFEPQ
jgi:serine/threonine protein kinase